MTSRSDNTRSRGRRGVVSRGRSSRENAGEGTSSRGASGPRRNYKWTPRTTRIFLELVIAELEAEDYTIRVPLAAGKRRIEEKFVELTGDSIEMEPSWWNDRCAEFGETNKKYITVLQNKPLPFQDLLDVIHSKHDLEQDSRYSPHMLGVHLDLEKEPYNDDDDDDDVPVDDTEENGRTVVPPDNSNLRAYDDDLPRLSRSPRETTRHARHSTHATASHARNTSTRRTHLRRANFEARIDGSFQRMEESRSELLNVVRSRQSSKPTYGDALAVLESLPIEPMNTFWWEANKLLMNDEDIRDGFMKLRSEENKIRHLERLSGMDRYGNPCDLINLRVTSSNSGSDYVRSDASSYGGTGSFGGASVGGGSTGGGSIGGGSTGGGSIGGGSTGGGSVGGGSIGGGSVGGGSGGDQGFDLGTWDNSKMMVFFLPLHYQDRFLQVIILTPGLVQGHDGRIFLHYLGLTLLDL
ncbi:uncharacterized protein LOC9313156 [Arabidopsis lyrata subsp. lyrata]|uniref:uncharacterized protein LOC9313156 n=1 Tax=Arabidopsis lyrata subsp. lyrata TaxID=81972 RepID=UPI000A29B0AB|nr:uncharacterized protein LOC9313156 [Arabidopsis lyrata subsp. lyrata]|eukprot:XP_020880737.1 uncharacterized protein LOC9313156 [Arabidopsis lyrata subsp. lyrata]